MATLTMRGRAPSKDTLDRRQELSHHRAHMVDQLGTLNENVNHLNSQLDALSELAKKIQATEAYQTKNIRKINVVLGICIFLSIFNVLSFLYGIGIITIP